MHPKHLLIATVIALAALGAGAAIASDTGGATLGATARSMRFAQLSNLGRHVDLPPQMQSQLQAAGLGGTASLLGESNGRAFYRLDGTSKGTCFALARPASSSFGFIRCAPGGFPTQAKLLLDFSIESIDRTTRTVTMYSAQGLAADGVAQVAILGQDGSTLATTRVTDNIYSFSDVPAAPATAIQALDAAGRVVYKESF